MQEQMIEKYVMKKNNIVLLLLLDLASPMQNLIVYLPLLIM